MIQLNWFVSHEIQNLNKLNIDYNIQWIVRLSGILYTKKQFNEIIS